MKKLFIFIISFLFVSSVFAKELYTPRFRVLYRNSRGDISSTKTKEGKQEIKKIEQKNVCLKTVISSLRAGIYQNETIRGAAHQLSKLKGFTGVEYELFLYATDDKNEKSALCNFSVMNLIVTTRFNTIEASSTHKINRAKVPLYDIFKTTVVSGKQALLLR